MTVERISFEGGLPLSRGGDVGAQIYDAIASGAGEIISLKAGEYELTPSDWTHNKYSHNLIVHPDGTGTYRILPLYADSGTIVFESGDLTVSPGGRQTVISGETLPVVIGSPDGNGEIRVYECIAYSPGVSPEA